MAFRFLYRCVFLCTVLLPGFSTQAQTVLPDSMEYEWFKAGVHDTNTSNFLFVNLVNEGFVGDGITPNDAAMQTVLNNVPSTGAILYFPQGEYLFTDPIRFGSNIVLRGEGHNNTTLIFDLDEVDHAITISGRNGLRFRVPLISDAEKRDTFILVKDTSIINTGDWIRLQFNDSGLYTSSWGKNTISQYVQIEQKIGDTLFLKSEVRRNFPVSKEGAVTVHQFAENSGIECLRILRRDNTAPAIKSNVMFGYTANCWVRGVQSDSCTFAHIEARNSSNLTIRNNFLNYAFEYGTGGRAYGVLLHFSTNECLVENNVFEHLRHSMMLQAGANCNVFAYNYSTNPYWESLPSLPSDAAGEISLEGNYPYANLFEHNHVRNIVISNSHGPNGPHNVFFRNRAEGFGIFMSESNSPNQAFIGNEITNSSEPYSLGNYSIKGADQFTYANYVKGSILPDNSGDLPEQSYYYTNQPSFVNADTWVSIGPPNAAGEGSIPARDRFLNAREGAATCSDNHTVSLPEFAEPGDENVLLFPNPARTDVTILLESGKLHYLEVYSLDGKLLLRQTGNGSRDVLNVQHLSSGTYLIKIITDQSTLQKPFVKH